MTIVIIIMTVLFSTAAFKRPELLQKYQFNAYQIARKNQWYRLITYAFLHANHSHLFINMIVLYSFGQALISYFLYNFDMKILNFIFLYLGGIIASTLHDLYKNCDQPDYNAVGASGATSAVVFATIFFAPLKKIYLFFIIPVPGIIFAALYLCYSYYMSKKNIDNIGHNAHFYGALFGFTYPIIVKPELIYLFLSHFNFHFY